MTSFPRAGAQPFSADHLALLDQLTPYNPADSLQAVSRLRAQGISAEDSSALLTQARLRTLGASKFGPAARHMLFTEAGYEQATRAAVAQHHAARFVAAGLASVADLGCGLGADSLAFAQAGLAVTSLELDPITASLAAHNLSPYPTAQVLVGNVEEVKLEKLTTVTGEPISALWLDPARREVESGSTTSRIFDPEAFSPPFSFLQKLAATGTPMGVKLGPALPHEAIPDGVEAEWVSHGGSVVEVVLWFNGLARPGVARSATVLGADAATRQVLGELTSPAPASTPEEPLEVTELGTYLIEPDGAVVRSHLVADYARTIGATLLDENIAYLTADSPADSPLGRAYRVLGTLPLNDKKLRRWVKEEGITALTVKKRGVDVLPEKLRATLLAGIKKKKGAGKEATLILTRLGQGTSSQRLAIWAEPA
ncbi:MAG: class I SAM-dependent methyltransferase [Rothia sp. (in: high G+C Gram-positive bacteria)]|nr:class I SAM-dependent methyltransferase [Rothia sp. (in: high G+C Gram-positive bacteria)]